MAEKVKDPVCGMTIDKDKAAATAQYQGQTYYFCAAACKKQFEKAPEKYVSTSHKSGGCH
ncbi:MAG: YHS domain-containing protein [Candidatus Bipolaricaulia bacterium]